MWPINLSISVAWQALTMQIFFNLKIMIGIYIFWGAYPFHYGSLQELRGFRILLIKINVFGFV